jgi:hypothetical protein
MSDNYRRKLTEGARHGWWLLSMLLMLVLLSFIVSSSTARLSFTIGSALLIPFFFLLTNLLANLKFLINVTRNKFSPSTDRPERPKASDLFWRLSEPQYLGWAIMYFGIVASINTGFSRYAALNPTGANPSFWALLDSSAPDITRASVIALLVVFFTQMQKHYESAVEKTKAAAEKAVEAAAKAEKVFQNAESLSPLVQGSVDTLQMGFNFLQQGTALITLREAFTTLYNSQKLSVFADVNQKISKHIGRLHGELLANRTDPFELATFATLYNSYLETEALSFAALSEQSITLDNDNHGPGRAENYGTTGIVLVTRFTNYALAVQAVVETLISLPKEKSDEYEFYTLLNRRPRQFFNIENSGADPFWSIKFIEDFCRRHHDEHVNYKRYFLLNRANDTEKERKELPNEWEVTQDLRSNILCHATGHQLPILWWKQNRALWKGDVLDENFFAVVTKYGRNYPISPPSYIIESPEKELDIDASDLTKVTTRTVRDVLKEYHNPEYPPRFLSFDTFERYDSFFGKEIPRDIFAIRDKQTHQWLLFMGTHSYGGSQAVTLLFSTKHRPLKNLTLDDNLSKILDTLFIGNPVELSSRGIRLYELGDTELREVNHR